MPKANPRRIAEIHRKARSKLRRASPDELRHLMRRAITEEREAKTEAKRKDMRQIQSWIKAEVRHWKAKGEWT